MTTLIYHLHFLYRISQNQSVKKYFYHFLPIILPAMTNNLKIIITVPDVTITWAGNFLTFSKTLLP